MIHFISTWQGTCRKDEKVDETALYPEKSTLEFDGAIHLSDQPGIGIQPDQQALENCLIKDL